MASLLDMDSGEGEMISVSIKQNGTFVLNPYGFICNTNLTFMSLIEQLARDSQLDVAKVNFNRAITLDDNTKITVHCADKLQGGSTGQVNVKPWNP